MMAMSLEKAVSTEFVTQYYYLLAHEPHEVHKFYKDTSKLVRVEDDGSTSTTTTIKAINEKIMSLYNVDKFEITSVDAQESSNMDVHILVTGFETGRDYIVREFAQSFLLEPTEKGGTWYYLLHDMFRYVGKANQLGVNQVAIKEVEQEVCVPGQMEDGGTDLEIEDDWVLC